MNEMIEVILGLCVVAILGLFAAILYLDDKENKKKEVRQTMDKEEFIQKMCIALKIPKNFYSEEVWNHIYNFVTEELIKEVANKEADNEQ